MIGSRPRLGTGFKGLQQYLLHGRNGAAPHRSAWVSTRNLPGGKPEQSAAIMRSTANRSQRVEKPVYHLSVSLAPGERLERAELEQVANRLLRDLGLGEHQALVAEHGDGAQQHIHLMVNRVHPDTAKAWSPWRDYDRIEGSLRRQEWELGLRVVPGRNAQIHGLDRVEGARLGKGAFPEKVRELVGEAFREAGSWQELHAAMEGKGLALQPSRTGRGLVVTDGKRFVAASKVGRGASRPRLEARLGAFQAASPELEKLAKVAHRMQRIRHLKAMRSRYRGAMRSLGKALSEHGRATEWLEKASKELDGLLRGVYRSPRSARERIADGLEKYGVLRVAHALAENPKAFGRLRGRVASRERREANRSLKDGRLGHAVRNFANAREKQRSSLKALERFRRNPRHPALEAAGRALKSLSRGIRKLDEIERRWGPIKSLERQAVRMVKRLGWKAVSRLVPSPAYQMLRVVASLAKAPGLLLNRGMGR